MDNNQGREVAQLRHALWGFYTASGRHDLPWRRIETDGCLDPYKVLVSELMLQQTQVPRVVPKFEEFIAQFADVTALAAAPLGDVLRVWNGLGYNRRAKFLWQTGGVVAADYAGELPASRKALMQLPGIGPNTAGAILAYAFNQPALFVETNIRSVFIHHFFADEMEVSDAQILTLLEMMIAHESDPRTFYWALMDYGTHLKQVHGNAARQSKNYTRQSRFAGSRRQVRGRVLRALASAPQTLTTLQTTIPDERLAAVLNDLTQEGLIVLMTEHYRLP